MESRDMTDRVDTEEDAKTAGPAQGELEAYGIRKHKPVRFPRLRAVVMVLRETWRQMQAADVQILASSLAFATVISFVPLLAVSLSVFKAYGGFEFLIAKIEPFILQNLVEASGAEASRYIRRVVTRIHTGAFGAAGVIGLLFTSTKLFHDMETAVQRVWQVRSTRSLLKRLIVYWVIIFIGPLILAAALGLIGSKDLGMVDVMPKGAPSMLIAFVGLLCINKLVPAVKVSWRSALISSAATTFVFVIAQQFYSSVMRKLFMLGKMYGSLASLPIFLIWILLLWWICLGGVALTATLEKGRKLERSEAKV